MAANAAPSVPDERANAEDEFRPSRRSASVPIAKNHEANGSGQIKLDQFDPGTNCVEQYSRKSQESYFLAIIIPFQVRITDPG